MGAAIAVSNQDWLREIRNSLIRIASWDLPLLPVIARPLCKQEKTAAHQAVTIPAVGAPSCPAVGQGGITDVWYRFPLTSLLRSKIARTKSLSSRPKRSKTEEPAFVRPLLADSLTRCPKADSLPSADSMLFTNQCRGKRSNSSNP